VGKDLGDRVGDLLHIGQRVELILAVAVVAGLIAVGVAALVGLPMAVLGGAAFAVTLGVLLAWGRPWRIGRASPLDTE
jgi:hypothetical protein